MTTELDALQATLAAEHAAVYVYGLLGSRTSQASEPDLYVALRAAYEAHRERRDTLIGEIAALAATPTPAAPAYTPPAGLDTTDGRYQAALDAGAGLRVDLRRPGGSHDGVAPARGHRAAQ